MSILKPRLLVAGAVACVCLWSASKNASPPTRTDNVTETLHGVKITDPYRWLEDQKSPETRAWIEAQTRFARSYLDALPGRADICAKLTGLLKIDSLQPPVVRNGKYFFSRRLGSEARYSICMRDGI